MPVQTKQQLLERIGMQSRQFRAYGVERVGVFGSFRHGQQTQQSDVDLLVEFVPSQKTFANFMKLIFFLRRTIGAKGRYSYD